tara:strand:- start:96 stop:350 length:255 start_codon:yes stop_codon:yes gene_type:complete
MKKTHKDRLVDYLSKHGSITSLEAIRDLGNTRLSATIHTLRHHDKYIIYSDMVEVENRFGGTTKVARYFADKNPISGELRKTIF